MIKQKKYKGFTLTELIVVIAIIGILAAVLIPSLSNYISRARVSNDKQDAANMTKILNLYEIENDVTLILASDIRSAILSVDDKYTFIPRSEGYYFLYNVNTKRIELETGEGVFAAGDEVKYIEEIVEGKMLLDLGGSPLADVVNLYYSISDEASYQSAVKKLPDLNTFQQTHFANFTPDNTIFMAEDKYYTAVSQDIVANLKNVVIANGVQKLTEDSFPNFPIGLPSLEITIPSSVSLILRGTFDNVTGASVVITSKETKVASTAFNSTYNIGQTFTSLNWVIYDLSMIDAYGDSKTIVNESLGFSPKLQLLANNMLTDVTYSWFYDMDFVGPDDYTGTPFLCSALTAKTTDESINDYTDVLEYVYYIPNIQFEKVVDGEKINNEFIITGQLINMYVPSIEGYKIFYRLNGQSIYSEADSSVGIDITNYLNTISSFRVTDNDGITLFEYDFKLYSENK